MVILFLDFDGVLHPMPAGEECVFARLPLLEEVLREHRDVQVVISSSWREVHPLDEMREYFSADLRSRIIGVTPQHPRRYSAPAPYQRHAECVAWLGDHRAGTPWLAIDVQADLFRPGCAQLLLVDGSTGMTTADADRLRVHLATSPREIEGASQCDQREQLTHHKDEDA